MSWLRDALQRLADQQAERMDAEISDTLWQAQIDPASVPRIVRLDSIDLGAGFVIPGTLMPDGASRLMVNTHQAANEAAAIAYMDAVDRGQDV